MWTSADGVPVFTVESLNEILLEGVYEYLCRCPLHTWNPSSVVSSDSALLVWRRDARKIRIFEHISLDGVIQAPGEPGEDGDYPYGGWTVPHADPVVGEVIVAAHREAFDLLLGRRTYDIWSGYWPKAGKSPLADSLNAATKYVATRTPDSLE